MPPSPEQPPRLRFLQIPVAHLVDCSPGTTRFGGIVARRDFAQSDLREIARLPANRLELEITESIFIANVEKTLETLHSLRALGVRIALDDFGTGYSSLSYLRSFPFDKLKIDQSFVRDLTLGGNANAVIRAITTLADALGMETLAEGVEDEAQAAILRQEGCHQIQGYLLSQPIDVAAVHRFIAAMVAETDPERLSA